jgi:hypothetical protein
LAALRPRHNNWADTVQEAKLFSAALAQADTLEVGEVLVRCIIFTRGGNGYTGCRNGGQEKDKWNKRIPSLSHN